MSRGAAPGNHPVGAAPPWGDGLRGKEEIRGTGMKINIPGDAVYQPGLQGWEQEGKGDWRGQGKAENSVVPP